MQIPPGETDRSYERSPFVAALVQALGIIDLFVTPVGVLLILAIRVGREEPLSLLFIAASVGALVAGVTLGGLLLGLAALIRYAVALRRPDMLGPHVRPEDEHAGPMVESIAFTEHDQSGTLEPAETKQILALLHEIRDLALLEPEERVAAQERVQANVQRHAAEAIVDAINLRQLGKARALLREAEARYGSTPTLERLSERIAGASTQHEPLDYVHTKRLVEEVISSGRWTLAERYVRALYLNHPDSARCRQLWDDTRRARLHAHIQTCVTEHHWDEALAAAQEFRERFPGSGEAETLRSQIGTLTANAEIQQRKQYEAKFKELINGHRYAEALRLAKRVIEQFPDSPQANALRPQIPAIEKRVTG
jgi:hypothetical protein